MNPEFDRYAAQYEELIRDPIRDGFAGGTRFFHQRKLQVIEAFFRRHSVDLANTSWLDVGCGAGDLLELGRERFAKAEGCDPSKEMMALRPHLKMARQSDMLKLPYNAESFDFVTAVCVYHHVPVDQRALLTAEVQRVLRPGGVFAMIEHNPWNPATRIIVSRTPVDVDAVLLRSSESRALMRGAGLRPLDTDYFLYLPEKLHGSLAPIESAMRKVPLGGQYAVFAARQAA